MESLIAVPSQAPGGLAAPVSAHFGHCDAFTLVTVRDGKIADAKVVRAPDHQQGGCQVPVNLLASAGVTAIVAQGMGRGPLLGFLNAGIQPYFAEGLPTVQDAVAAFLSGGLRSFGVSRVCGGEEHAH